MKQLTIRGFDPRLTRRIRELARIEGISLNKAVMRLLEKGAGLSREDPAPDVVGDSLDSLIGTWTREEAEELDQAIEDLSRVDPGLWT